MASRSNFVSNLRTDIQGFLTAMDTFRSLKRQWDALGYSGNIVSADLVGANADLAPADVANFISSMQAVDDFCTNNFHYSNLEKAKV